MSTPLPGEPEGGRRGTAGGPAAGAVDDRRNAYADRYEHSGAAPDLDAGAPQLRSMDLRRMNRRALGFLAATILLLLVLAFLVLKAAGGARPPPKPRPETVRVPSLPQQPIVSRAPRPTPVAAAPVLLPPMPLPVVPAQPPVPPSPQPAFAQSPPSLLQRRAMADEVGLAGSQGDGQALRSGAMPGNGPVAGQRGRDGSRARALVSPDTLMLRGTYVRCVLETRIVSDIPGFTSCVVAEPIYSFDGRHLLVPKGSKVFGEYNHGPVGTRIAVIWDRIVTPSGIDVNMSNPGVDSLGGAGLPGDLNSHWPSRIGSALLISLMSDAFLYEGERHGPRTDNISPGGGFVVQSPFQSNTAQTLQSLANQAVQQSANRKATLTINQGSVIAIYVTKDVDFSGVVARN